MASVEARRLAKRISSRVRKDLTTDGVDANVRQQSRLFDIAKRNDEQQLVFGFALVAQRTDGTPLEDMQGDSLTPDTLERGAYDFMLKHALGGEMHEDRPATGKVIESFVVLPEKLEAMGVPADIAKRVPARWWIGVKFDREAFEKVKRGDYQMFSVQGSGQRIPLAGA